MKNTSYRPQNPGHDYYGCGVYLESLVMSGRAPLLERLGNNAMHLSPHGENVQQEWKAKPTLPGCAKMHSTTVAKALLSAALPRNNTDKSLINDIVVN